MVHSLCNVMMEDTKEHWRNGNDYLSKDFVIGAYPPSLAKQIDNNYTEQ